jgi:hypothetical protein
MIIYKKNLAWLEIFFGFPLVPLLSPPIINGPIKNFLVIQNLLKIKNYKIQNRSKKISFFALLTASSAIALMGVMFASDWPSSLLLPTDGECPLLKW